MLQLPSGGALGQGLPAGERMLQVRGAGAFGQGLLFAGRNRSEVEQESAEGVLHLQVDRAHTGAVPRSSVLQVGCTCYF